MHVEMEAMRMPGRVVEGWSCALRETVEVPMAANVRNTSIVPITIVAMRSVLRRWELIVSDIKRRGEKKRFTG